MNLETGHMLFSSTHSANRVLRFKSTPPLASPSPSVQFLCHPMVAPSFPLFSCLLSPASSCVKPKVKTIVRADCEHIRVYSEQWRGELRWKAIRRLCAQTLMWVQRLPFLYLYLFFVCVIGWVQVAFHVLFEVFFSDDLAIHLGFFCFILDVSICLCCCVIPARRLLPASLPPYHAGYWFCLVMLEWNLQRAEWNKSHAFTRGSPPPTRFLFVTENDCSFRVLNIWSSCFRSEMDTAFCDPPNSWMCL